MLWRVSLLRRAVVTTALQKKERQPWVARLDKIYNGSLRFERFLHWELQLCFGQGFHHESSVVFGCQIARVAIR